MPETENVFPNTQDNFYCKTYPKGKHRVVYGTCQKPSSNGNYCKICMSNPKGENYFKRIDVMMANESEEKKCSNCKYASTPSTVDPCEKCLDFGTQYPYWKPREEI